MKNRALVFKEGIVSIVGNVLLFIIKFYAGIQTGSIAIIADSWHTLSDSFSSLVLIIGTKLSQKPADEKHPYGHGRYELISTLIIGFLLFLVSISFFKDSIVNYLNRVEIDFGKLAIIVTIISIIIKEIMAEYAFWIGKKSGNTAVKADGWHHRSDAFSSLIILIGIFLKKYCAFIDEILGIIISLIIFYTAFTIIKETIDKILGEAPTPDTVNYIKNISFEIAKENISPHNFHIHNYITHSELTFHVLLNSKMSLKDAHALITKIENEIKSEKSIEVTIHPEPIEN